MLTARHWAAASGESNGRAVVLAGSVQGDLVASELEPIALRLQALGYAVLALDELGGAEPTDRRCTAELDAAGQWLLEGGADPDGLLIVGLGRGATLAFLTACQSSRFQAVVTFDGDVAYPGLDAARPVQPHEMALNLGAPLLAHFAAGGDASAPTDPVPEDEIELLRSKLDAFAKPYEIAVYPGLARGFGSSPAAEEAWERTWGFLDEVL